MSDSMEVRFFFPSVNILTFMMFQPASMLYSLFHLLKRGKTYVDYNKQPRVVGNELKVINHLNGFSVSILYKVYITQSLTGQMLQLWCRMLFLASANHDLLFFL